MSKVLQRIIYGVVIGTVIVLGYFIFDTEEPIGAVQRTVLNSKQFVDNKGRDVVAYSYVGNKVTNYPYEILNENSVKISEHTTRFFMGHTFTKKANEWHFVEYATTTPQDFATVSGRFRLVRTAYAQQFVMSSDGVGVSEDAVWQTAHDAAAWDSAPLDQASNIGPAVSTTEVYNAIMCSDTSSLSGTVASASLFIWPSSKQDDDNDGMDYVGVVDLNPANYAAPAVGDFDQRGFSLYSDSHDITGVTTGQFLEFVLNASGIANIDINGTSCFAVSEGHDIENTAPSGTNFLVIFYTEQAGTANDPYFDITMASEASTPVPSSVPIIIDF